MVEADKSDGELVIYDNTSMNHTWKNDKKLKPLVRYSLCGDDKLTFGNVKAVFRLQQNRNDQGKNDSTFLAGGSSK